MLADCPCCTASEVVRRGEVTYLFLLIKPPVYDLCKHVMSWRYTMHNEVMRNAVFAFEGRFRHHFPLYTSFHVNLGLESVSIVTRAKDVYSILFFTMPTSQRGDEKAPVTLARFSSFRLDTAFSVVACYVLSSQHLSLARCETENRARKTTRRCA
jgi:hypothetical protein